MAMAGTSRVHHSSIDPEWNPSVLLTRRLRDASVSHASRLAERTTIESSLLSSSGYADNFTATDKGGEGVHPLAKIAISRSSCPQPPLDDGITGGGSSVSCDVHFSGMNVRLDPLERCAPHRIVVPQSEENADKVRGELDGAYDAQFGEQRSATWNAITALSTLCDEIQELDTAFQSQILPSIVLFSADDSIALNRSESKKDILDEEAQERRESALLARIGKFLPALQSAANGTARIRRLVKNMVVQLGAVQTPSAVPFYYDVRQNENDGSSKNEDDGMSTSVANNGNGTSPIPTHVKSNKVEGEQSMQPPVFGPGVPMFSLGKAIATALRILVAIDTAVSSNTDLQEAWGMYKDVVMEWSEQKRTDNTLDSEFESFERMMVQLDFNLLSSRSFNAAVEQNFDPRGRFQAARFPLYDELKNILVTLYSGFCERINTEHETTERLDCVGVYAMYVLYRHLLPPNIIPDAKLHKSLWSVFPAMCPVMELYGPLHFIPREFMMLHAPYKAVKGCSADIPEIRSAAATMVLKWDGSFRARVAKIRLDALGWIAMADSELSPIVPEPHSRSEFEDDDVDVEETILAPSVAIIEAATSCILNGMRLAHSAAVLLRSQLVTHRALGLTYSDQIPSLISLMEVLKSIEKILRVRRRPSMLSFQRSTLKMIASNILKRFEKVRSFVDQCSSSIDFSRDPDRTRSIARVRACLTALEGVLKGSSSFSPIRRHSIAFSIAACMDTMILEVFTTNDLLAVEGHLKDLSKISSIEDTLNKACDCSFLYFYRDMFPQSMRTLYQTSVNSALIRSQLVLSAFSDPEKMLKHVRHLERDPVSGINPCLAGYRSFILNVLKEEYSEPIGKLIETDLRLVASGGAKGVDVRLRKFITCPPLYVCHMKWCVKSEVENYLDKTFYDLCTLSLNDCNTYNEMRTIANERFGLNLTDPYLPDGSLEQADFIEILRNLEVYISKYNYNLIEQSFVERKPERGAKWLNSLNIDTISASFRQHGLGMVSSAVNTCYKLLARKFQMFTDFLADDNAKSLLSREFRWFENQKGEGNTIYPFDRASAFAKEIKKLEAESGNNGLDECRVIVSEIGNVIALVRMIRAAKRRVFSDEMQFLPCYNIPGTVKSLNEGRTNDAKSSIDNAVSDILNKPDPDFVRAFVGVFRGVIQKSESENAFMGNFFCIVPALCLCWMEASIQGKEMMHKKNITRDGYYTDDGFAVGLAFALSVLGQTKTYESLNWFKSIQSKYTADEEDLMEKRAAAEVKRKAKIAVSKQGSWFSTGAEDKTQEEEDEMTILNLMGKRLEGHRREMAMLFFSMHGAETFFKEIRSN
mmetsp:Transcript_21613/g.52202  ORF Transcript_21613/g.52202 Transcript_21613/m.52202 type:complete len:1326 (+) Transcript_21613:117-4094(+)